MITGSSALAIDAADYARIRRTVNEHLSGIRVKIALSQLHQIGFRKGVVCFRALTISRQRTAPGAAGNDQKKTSRLHACLP